MISRNQFESRYLPPDCRFTDAQWAHVRTWLSLDGILEATGKGFGKSVIRSAIARYLLDQFTDADAAILAGRGDVEKAARTVLAEAVELDRTAGREETVPERIARQMTEETVTVERFGSVWKDSDR